MFFSWPPAQHRHIDSHQLTVCASACVLTNTANGLAKGARDSGNKVCRLTQLQHLKKDGAHSSVTSVQPYLSQIKQQLSQLLLARKVTVSLNFGNRSYGGILRPPAVLMFYDFAPHGDGANNNPIADVLGRLVLRLLSVFKCVHSDRITPAKPSPAGRPVGQHGTTEVDCGQCAQAMAA
jgi:hypothetical protein